MRVSSVSGKKFRRQHRRLSSAYGPVILLRMAEATTVKAAALQTRALPARNLRDQLFDNLEHPRWDEVAGRCIAWCPVGIDLR